MSQENLTPPKDSSKEADYLYYTGNNIPRVIRYAWAIFFIFLVVYLARYMWPDLMDWLAK